MKMKKIQITARTRTPEPITQSVLDKAVERGKVLRLADWLEDQYDPTHNQAQAAAELRRLSEIETLYLAAMRGRHAMSEELLTLTTQRDQLLEALKLIAGLITNESARQKALDAISKVENA